MRKTGEEPEKNCVVLTYQKAVVVLKYFVCKIMGSAMQCRDFRQCSYGRLLSSIAVAVPMVLYMNCTAFERCSVFELFCCLTILWGCGVIFYHA